MRSYLCPGEVMGEDIDLGSWEFGMMGGNGKDLEVNIKKENKGDKILVCVYAL